MRIDAHQHFWIFNEQRDSWITEEMNVIRRSFLPEDLAPILKTNGIEGCVAVQADQSEEETEFLLTLSQKHNFIKGVVGWIDLQAIDITERLQVYQSNKTLKGFRHILQGEQQRDMMLQPAFRRGLAEIGKQGYTYDILIYSDQLKFIPELLAAHPDQKFIIDHLAKPDIKNDNLDEWAKEMKAVSRFENISCKISGLVTEADWKNWKETDFTPFLDEVVSAFGTKRLLFGSDYPVCLLAADDYAQVLGIIEHYFSEFSKEEKDDIFEKNAISFYNL